MFDFTVSIIDTSNNLLKSKNLLGSISLVVFIFNFFDIGITNLHK